MNRPDAVLKVNLYLDGELVEKLLHFRLTSMIGG